MKIDISHITKLANLEIKEDQKKMFEEQLSSVLDYVSKLNELDTTNVEPTSQVTGLENVLREDIASHSLTQEETISQAKIARDGKFVVKGIFEDE